MMAVVKVLVILTAQTQGQLSLLERLSWVSIAQCIEMLPV